MSNSRPDFQTLLKAFLRNPDGPEGLALQSAVNTALAPRLQAVQTLTEALAHQITEPGVAADTAVVVATCVYEAHVQPLDATLLADFRVQARRLVHERRCQPPPIERILALSASPEDAEYHFAGMLGGVRGCWHRLWMSDAMQALGVFPAPSPGTDPIQHELEGLLGRQLLETERQALREHAQAHAVYLGSPEAQAHLNTPSQG